PRFLIAPDKDAFYCNGYGIYFNELPTGLWENSVNPIAKSENILLLQKILNSIVMHYYVSVTSVSIQGGYPCYQKNFIEKFTIPNFTIDELEILKSLNKKEEIDSFLIEKYQLSLPVPNLVS
ncbi:MAG: DNA methyltransferase, partial [Bacteroidota bacterium]|nr:DNA methyltransferase [Bacteroidota bacterium]